MDMERTLTLNQRQRLAKRARSKQISAEVIARNAPDKPGKILRFILLFL